MKSNPVYICDGQDPIRQAIMEIELEKAKISMPSWIYDGEKLVAIEGEKLKCSGRSDFDQAPSGECLNFGVFKNMEDYIRNNRTPLNG